MRDKTRQDKTRQIFYSPKYTNHTKRGNDEYQSKLKQDFRYIQWFYKYLISFRVNHFRLTLSHTTDFGPDQFESILQMTN